MSRIKVNRPGIIYNLRKLQKLCHKNSCELVPVTKLMHSYKEVLSELHGNGIGTIAEVNIEAIKDLTLPLKKMLLKTTPSSLRDTVLNCDMAFISELEVLRILNSYQKASLLKVIVPIEMGDLREGVNLDEVINFFKEALALENINVAGFAVNFGCLSGKLPDDTSLNQIENLKTELKDILNYKPEIVSIGGTVIIEMLEKGKLKGVGNQVRIGEAIYFGYNTSGGYFINGLKKDNIIFQAEVIEVRKKEVKAYGRMGLNAYGENKKIENIGVRKRAVLNFGSLTLPRYGFSPVDKLVTLEGMTHDLSVFDVTESNLEYKPGTIMDFRLNYSGAAQAFLNKNITISIN